VISIFVAKKEEILSEIKKINDYLKECLRMHFVIRELDCGYLKLCGAIDQILSNYNDSDAIGWLFQWPSCVSTLLKWSIDTSKPFIQLCTKEEEYELNGEYWVEEGNYYFKINVEGFENPPIFICAKKLICVILNDNPFPEKQHIDTS